MLIFNRLEKRLVLPGDSETRRSQKAIAVLLIFAGSALTMINVSSYLALGITSAGLAYLGLILVVFPAAVAAVLFPRLWQPLGYLVIIATIVFNLAAHIFAGGFQSGLEAAVWMTLGPIAASLFFSSRFTIFTLVVYIICVVIAAFLEPVARAIAPEIELPVRMRIAARSTTELENACF